MSDFETWQENAVTSLKGKPIEKITHNTLDGLCLSPLYTKDNASLASPRSQNHAYPQENFAIMQHISVHETSLIPDPVFALNEGASALCFVPFTPILAQSWQDILAPIHLDMIALRLDGVDEHENGIDEFLTSIQDRSIKDVNLGIDPIAQIAKTGGYHKPKTSLSAHIQSLIENHGTATIKPFMIDARPYANAGASAALEIALCLSALNELINFSGGNAQKTIEASEILLTLDVDLFGTIAKFRAMRIAFANFMKARGVNATLPAIHGEMGRYALSALDENVNILRASAAAFGGVISGAKSITLLPHRLFSNPDDPLSHRIIRNIQLMFQEESHLDQVLDAASGSFYLESRTHALAQQAWNDFLEIQRQGGILSLLETGDLQTKLEEISINRQKQIASRKIPLTGVSEFANANDKVILSEEISSPAPLHAYCTALPVTRRAEAFEAMRLKGQEDASAHFTLITLGTPAQHSARLNFTQNVLSAVGFGYDVLSHDDTVKSQSKYLCLCGSNEAYLENAPTIIKALREHNPKAQIFIAGKLSGELESLNSCDFAGEIGLGMDLIAFAEGVLD